jgi:AcrR family transcriptional regulator
MNQRPKVALLGLRERNKIDKLRRIEDAARELFIAKGFDDTTTREIAIRAGVGMGTIFLYAGNKRDLLFLIANDELAAIADKAATSFRSGVPVVTNLMRTFRLHYEFFGVQPALSRFELREMMFYDSGQQAKRFQATRDRVIALMTQTVRAGQEHGLIKRGEDAAFIGWIAFCIYQIELRRWLTSDTPDLQAGLKRLEKALRLFLSGAGTPDKASAAAGKARPMRRRNAR